MAEDLRVLVVADDQLVRAGLAALLAAEQGFIVVGQDSGYADLSTSAEVSRADVIVCDLGWDAAGAIARLEDLASPGMPVLALLSDALDAGHVMATGARGVLRRTRSVAAIAAALRAVAEGLTVRDPDLGQGEGRVPPADGEAFTPRELEVLRLLAQGLPNKTIADTLGVTDHTAKFHVASIMSKLGAQSRTEAVVLATRAGLIPL